VKRLDRVGLTAAIGLAVYVVVFALVLKRADLPPMSVWTGVILAGAALIQLGSVWFFGELFRSGLDGGVSPWSAFQAALVGSTVARLLPAGGAVTPVAMAWTVREEAPGAGGAAIRATSLNYAALLVGTGLSLALISFLDPPAGWATWMRVAAAVAVVIGLGLMALTTRLGAVAHRLPEWLRSRLGQSMVDLPVDSRAQVLMWGRLGAEALVLGIVLTAFGLPTAPVEVAAAFGLSQIAAGIPGTPGGVGFAEAGLVGALAVFGLGASVTLAPILVFRLVSYWLPAGAGLLAGSRVFLAARGTVSV
jgi:undecaprenyl-diphosphatase